MLLSRYIAYVFLLFLWGVSFSVLFATEDGFVQEEPTSKRKREDNWTPMDVADFFVYIDNKRYKDDPQRSPVDPLKLQKLVYYAFGYLKECVGIDLWDWGKNPMIAYYHGPYLRSVNTKYSGYNIRKEITDDLIMKKEHSLREDIDIYLEAVYLMFLSKTGKKLELQTHEEYPYLGAEFCEQLKKEDIVKEFQRPTHISHFLRHLNKACRRNGKADFLVPVLGKFFKTFGLKCYESLLGINISWAEETLRKHFDFYEGQSPLDAVIGTAVYPQALLDQFDALDSIYGRPKVIEALAIATRFGNKRARNDFAAVFRFFSVEKEDIYNKTAKLLQEEVSSVPAPKKPGGYEPYEEAQKKGDLCEAIRLYEDSLNQGYARSAFELAKIYWRQKNTEKAISCAKEAFYKGMLTATDFMLSIQFDDVQDYLKKRGELGDPRGYYDLALYLERLDKKDEAVEYYKMSLPFWGYSELKRLGDSSLRKEDLDDFFREVVRMSENTEIIQIWEKVSTSDEQTSQVE